MTKSSSVAQHLAEVVVAVDPDPQASAVEAADIVEARLQAIVCREHGIGLGARPPRSMCPRVLEAGRATRSRAPASARQACRARRCRAARARTPGLLRCASVACSSAVRRPSVVALWRYQCLERREERRRLIAGGDLPPPRCSVHARRDALVVAAQLVDREVPARSLMLDRGLHDRQRAGRRAPRGRTRARRSAPACA